MDSIKVSNIELVDHIQEQAQKGVRFVLTASTSAGAELIKQILVRLDAWGLGVILANNMTNDELMEDVQEDDYRAVVTYHKPQADLLARNLTGSNWMFAGISEKGAVIFPQELLVKLLNAGNVDITKARYV